MEKEKQEVIVVDLKMPFISMVVFMVKLALAAIPALSILIVFSLVVASMIGGFGASLLSFDRYKSSAPDAQNKPAIPIAVSPAVPTTPEKIMIPSPHAAEKACKEYVNARFKSPTSGFVFTNNWDGELIRGELTLKSDGETKYFTCNMEKSGLGWRVISAALP